MRKMSLIFGITAMFALGLGAAIAQENRVALQPGQSLHLGTGCVGRDGAMLRPVAVADKNGTVILPTGQEIRGYPPSAEICNNLPLKNAAVFKCDHLRLAEARNSSFCKRAAIAGRTCKHLVCD